MSDEEDEKIVSIDGGEHRPDTTIIDDLHNLLDKMKAQDPEVLQASQGIVIIMDPSRPTNWRIQKGCKLQDIISALEIVKLQYIKDGKWI